MADGELREHERLAADGDPDAVRRLRHARCRVGDCCAHELKAPDLPAAMPPIPKEARSCKAWVSNFTPVQISTYGSLAAADLTIRLMGSVENELQLAREWFLCTFPDRPSQDFDALRSLGHSFYGPRSNHSPVKLVEVGCRECWAREGVRKDCERCQGRGVVLYRSDRLPDPIIPTLPLLTAEEKENLRLIVDALRSSRSDGGMAGYRSIHVVFPGGSPSDLAARLEELLSPEPKPSAQYTTCATCWAGETADQNLCLTCDGSGRVFATS